MLIEINEHEVEIEVGIEVGIKVEVEIEVEVVVEVKNTEIAMRMHEMRMGNESNGLQMRRSMKLPIRKQVEWQMKWQIK